MRFPAAVWRGPVPNESGVMVRPILGLVLHIEEGSEAGTDAWFHDRSARASSHFGNPRSGRLDQWVDTGVKAWAEVAGNSRWVSVEHEGHSGDSLTASQLENDAQLLAWLHTTEGVPLQLSNVPGTAGLGYHAMGGNAWGGHFDCPGGPIIAARSQIVARAQQIVSTAPAPSPPPLPMEDEMPTVVAQDFVVNPADPSMAYVLDARGGLSAKGRAKPIDMRAEGVYWPGPTGPARKVAIIDWSKPAGYVLDCLGGVSAFGGAPPFPRDGVYWPGGFVPPAPVT